MARSTIKFLKQQGQFDTRIASLVGCDRHTVARVLTEPTDRPRRRQRASTLEERRAAVRSWIAEAIPTTRMLELARQDPAAPYTGGASTFYRFVARLRAEREAGASPVIRFEGLPGEYVQWDWGEARVRLGGEAVKRVFLAGRLKYSRVSAIRWRTQMDLETLLRAMLEIVAGWGGVPWAWVFDNMKTVTLGRDARPSPGRAWPGNRRKPRRCRKPMAIGRASCSATSAPLSDRWRRRRRPTASTGWRP